MIQIETRHLEIVLKITKNYSYKFFVFGSRATGTARKFSDLDLCTFDKISDREIGELKEKFENSHLPFTVDIVNLNRCSHSFIEAIRNDLIEL